MPEQKFRWMDTDSDAVKISRWGTAAKDAVPREVWYHGPRSGRTELTEAFLESLRLQLWDAKKPRLIAGIDVKLDETLTINGVPMLRITMPGRFVPTIASDVIIFYAYKVAAGIVVLDFGRLLGGPVAEEHRRASPLTRIRMGDIAFDEAPAPRGVIVSERARAEAKAARTDSVAAEVESIFERPPPRVIGRFRRHHGLREPQVYYAVRPSYPTCVPETPAASDALNSRAANAALSLFGQDDRDDTPVSPGSRPTPAEPDKPAVPVGSPPNYGRIAAFSSAAAVVIIGLLYAAWTCLASP